MHRFAHLVFRSSLRSKVVFGLGVAVLSFPQFTFSQEVKLPELTNHSRKTLQNLVAFLQSKHCLDDITPEVLPQKLMNSLESCEDKANMVQNNKGGMKVSSWEELLEMATLAKPIFDNVVRTVVEECGLSPDEDVRVDDNKVLIDAKNLEQFYRVHTTADLKSKARCAEKVRDDYGGDYSQLVDVVRCSVVVNTEKQLKMVADFLEDAEDIILVRFKNRYLKPYYNGYRDALYNILIDCGNGTTHVCELQLQLAPIVALKNKSHVPYDYFRDYFAGGSATDARLESLHNIEKLLGYTLKEDDVDRMLIETLQGSDQLQLKALANLVEHEQFGDVHLAALVFSRLYELAPDDVDAINECARAYYLQGRYIESEMLYQKALATSQRIFGESHPTTLSVMNNLAIVLHNDLNDFDAAEALYRQVLNHERSEQDLEFGINNLAVILRDQDKYAESEALLRGQLYGQRQKNAVQDFTLHNLATVLQKRGKCAEAQQLYSEAAKNQAKLLGKSHLETMTSERDVRSMTPTNNSDIKKKAFEAALKTSHEIYGPNNHFTLVALADLGEFLSEHGDFNNAEPLLQDAIARSRVVRGSVNVHTLDVVSRLGEHYLRQKQFLDAEKLFREALYGRQLRFGDTHSYTATAKHNLGVLLHKQGRLDEAEPLLRSAVSIGDRLYNLNYPFYLRSLALLLEDQNSLQKAEFFLRKAATLLENRNGRTDPDFRNTVRALKLLLQKQGKPDDADTN